MPRFTRLHVLGAILEDGLVPVFYHPEVEVALEAARACHRGGARTFEFTNRGDGAHRVFEELCRRAARELPDLVLGAGSIGEPYTAALYLAAGAGFVVGPVLNADVARLCNRRKVAYAPGCGTASEIAAAEELGSEIVKIFPGDSLGGPEFVKAILGPCPWSSLLPTGGVEPARESVRAWIGAGAAALGMGSKLISKELVQRRDWEGLAEKVRELLAWIREARGAPSAQPSPR
jgi:2-dehydro-3-deoxyphosphogluconate aldolase/(4S)-4-hydroxy-2-oxoglutarate aldolase